MAIQEGIPADRFRPILRKDLDTLPQIKNLNPEDRLDMKVVSAVLPFRTNAYVVDHLIDWDNIPYDPMYQLTFPQRGMLDPKAFSQMADLVENEAPPQQIEQLAQRIRMTLNPHPAGQMELNVPRYKGEPVNGLQHKYGDTALLFPSAGQTCHAYCTYCFRWPQFVGMEDLKFAAKQPDMFHAYIKEHKEISDVLFTGGDPMIMSTRRLRDYIEPFLGPGFEHVRQIRIGTKAPAYWPQRFVTDADADDFMRLIGEIRDAKKLPAIMAHFSHPAEMQPAIARQAISRLQDAGAIIRTQAPLIRHVNDSSTIWERLWSLQVQLGCIPYYMFIERDTGAKKYFEVPLAEALDIFRGAFHSITGLARTVRGPSMSATPGKINIDGVTEINGEKYFSLSFLRARNPHWVRQPFLAKYSDTATWITDLKPAFENSFFFEDDMARSLQNASAEDLRDTTISESA